MDKQEALELLKSPWVTLSLYPEEFLFEDLTEHEKKNQQLIIYCRKPILLSKKTWEPHITSPVKPECKEISSVSNISIDRPYFSSQPPRWAKLISGLCELQNGMTSIYQK